MKNFKLLITFCMMIISTGVKAQFFVQFACLQDGHIYFVVRNVTNFPQPLGWVVENEESAEYKSGNQFVNTGQTLLFGPNIGWKWQKGEKFIGFTIGGMQYEYICPYSDRSEISFQSGVHGSCNIPSHGCSGYVDKDNNNLCDNCPKSERCHITRHQTR